MEALRKWRFFYVCTTFRKLQYTFGILHLCSIHTSGIHSAYLKHTLRIHYLYFIYALSILYQCYIYAIYTLYVLSIFLVSITFFYWILLLSRLRSNWQYWSFWNSIFFLWLSWLRWTWQDLELIWWVLDFARIDRVWSCFGSTVLDTFCNSKSLAFLLQNTWSDGGGKSVLQFSTSLELTILEFLKFYIFFVAVLTSLDLTGFRIDMMSSRLRSNWQGVELFWFYSSWYILQ